MRFLEVENGAYCSCCYSDSGFCRYAALTYLRLVLSIPISFTAGVQFQTREFKVPFLHNMVEVEVVVDSDTSLWTPRIMSQDNVLWSARFEVSFFSV